MRHRLFTLLSALSLVVCVAACISWVRSYFWWDELGYTRYPMPDCLWRFEVHPAVGLFSCSRDVYRVNTGTIFDEDPSEPPGWYAKAHRQMPDETERFLAASPYFRLFDFQANHRVSSFVAGDGRTSWHDQRSIVVPYWALVGALGILPTVQVRRHLIDRHRRQRGACRSCGYDLRATPDRCPECGAVPIKSPAPA